MKLTDLNFIQVCWDLQIIRIYYVKHEFFLSHVSMDEIKYNAFKSSVKVLTYIMKQLTKAKHIDMRFYNNIITKKRS